MSCATDEASGSGSNKMEVTAQRKVCWPGGNISVLKISNNGPTKFDLVKFVAAATVIVGGFYFSGKKYLEHGTTWCVHAESNLGRLGLPPGYDSLRKTLDPHIAIDLSCPWDIKGSWDLCCMCLRSQIQGESKLVKTYGIKAVTDAVQESHRFRIFLRGTAIEIGSEKVVRGQPEIQTVHLVRGPWALVKITWVFDRNLVSRVNIPSCRTSSIQQTFLLSSKSLLVPLLPWRDVKMTAIVSVAMGMWAETMWIIPDSTER